MIAATLARYKLGAEILVFSLLASAGIYGVHLVLEHARDAGRAEVRAEWDRASAAAEARGRDARVEIGVRSAATSPPGRVPGSRRRSLRSLLDQREGQNFTCGATSCPSGAS